MNPADPPNALHLLHVGSMDAHLIGLSIERRWTRSIHLVASLADAQVVLIDCDRPGMDAALSQLEAHPHIGVVFYAFHPGDHAPRFHPQPVLGKPLRLEHLPTTLSQARTEARSRTMRPTWARLPVPPAPKAMPSSTEAPAAAPLGHGLMSEDERDLCGAMDDIPATPGAPLPDKLFFEPDDYLVGRVHQACALAKTSGCPQVISGLPRLLAIEPRPAPACISSFRENQLRPLAMTQLPAATGKVVGTRQVFEADRNTIRMAVEDLLWNTAAWAARGRLPRGTDPYAPVRLRAWPCFTRAFVWPHAMRIVALWTRMPASPVDIARRLDIPHRYVFSVYSAAHLAGLLDRRPQPSVNIAPLKVETSATAARPSILSRILRKLRDAV